MGVRDELVLINSLQKDDRCRQGGGSAALLVGDGMGAYNCYFGKLNTGKMKIRESDDWLDLMKYREGIG
jgi:hypothetical protein